jgi:hypothetical protein
MLRTATVTCEHSLGGRRVDPGMASSTHVTSLSVETLAGVTHADLTPARATPPATRIPPTPAPTSRPKGAVRDAPRSAPSRPAYRGPAPRSVRPGPSPPAGVPPRPDRGKAMRSVRSPRRSRPPPWHETSCHPALPARADPAAPGNSRVCGVGGEGDRAHDVGRSLQPISASRSSRRQTSRGRGRPVPRSRTPCLRHRCRPDRSDKAARQAARLVDHVEGVLITRRCRHELLGHVGRRLPCRAHLGIIRSSA